MAYTLDQYRALCDALASGAKYVKYSDKEVEYRSTGEMLLLKGMMERELGLVRVNSRRRVGVYSKGLTERPCRPTQVANVVSGGVVVPSRVNRGVTVYIKTSPDPMVLVPVGDKYIHGEYAPGNTLTLIEVRDGVDAGAYLAGKAVVMPVYKNNEVYQAMGYNSTSGTIDNTVGGGFADGSAEEGGRPDMVTVNFIDTA